MKTTFVCPHCKKEVEISEAFAHDVEEKIRAELAQKESIEITDLKKALQEKDKKMDEFRDRELELREEKRKLEEKEKELNLVVQRQIDDERKKIEEKVIKQSAEEHRLKDLEKEKKISDMEKLVEELKRKAQQGSQQTQGEVLELDLEHLLTSTFPHDEIQPVGKGIRGADIKQVVKSPKGYICGVILWESKRTKAWSDGWVSKLKEDLRSEKANIPVIVSSVTPKEAETGMGLKDGVWVVKYPLAVALASLLRKNLLDIGYQKAIASQKGEKSDMLYEYVTGYEFRQQVESLAESYNEMMSQLVREKTALQKSWKTREAQIQRMILATGNIYGKMQGLVGSSMPQVKGLEMMELESGE
jgi:hypothetical protein